jgi:hypothetical protein
MLVALKGTSDRYGEDVQSNEPWQKVGSLVSGYMVRESPEPDV